jgi:hypothetical protein
MISLKEWMELVDYRITEGSDFCWHCFGDDAYTLDSWNGDNETGHSLSIWFDTKTQEVYQVDINDYKNQRAYRLINPKYVLKYQQEATNRNIRVNGAWDDIDYVDLEIDADFIEKGKAVIAGNEYDTNVQIQIEFTDEELLTYMKMAHSMNITFNNFVENALQHAIKEGKI